MGMEIFREQDGIEMPLFSNIAGFVVTVCQIIEQLAFSAQQL